MTENNIIKNHQLKQGNLAKGSGYSSDSQQIAQQACYNTSIASTSGQQGYAELNTAMSFTDLQRSLKIDVSAKLGIGKFSASAEAHYMRSIEDKDYSLSLSYYQYAEDSVSLKIGGYGSELALNNLGKSFYSDGSNPYFGLLCGDQFITEYKQGAMLVMSLNINFMSHYEKMQFEGKAGASFGNIISASGDIQRIAIDNHISGSVIIQAYQKGGEPEHLSQILSKDSSGDYYALTCSLQSMNNCIKAANGLLDYAKNDFSTQFSFQNNTGLTPLGMGFATYLPIKYIGLITPKSLVNQTVINDRLKLSNAVDENKYYEQKFEQILYGYPVTIDEASSFYQNTEKLYKQAQHNVDIIMNPSNPEQGGLGCFIEPDSCNTIATTILSTIQSITSEKLQYLNSIKYTMPIAFGTLFPTGINDGYAIVPGPIHPNGDKFLSLVSLTLNNSTLNVVTRYMSSQPVMWIDCENGHSNDGIFYTGESGYGDSRHGTGCEYYGAAQWSKIISPYYFSAYDGSSVTDEGNNFEGM